MSGYRDYEKKLIEEYKKNIKSQYENSKRKIEVTIVFSVLVFLVLLVTFIVVGAIVSILYYTGVLQTIVDNLSITSFVVLIVSTCLLAGMVMAYLGGKFPLSTVADVINAMRALSEGKYNVRVKPRPILGKLAPFRTLTESLNNMAQELERNEMLRSDFINNFSHEFKTPIVSIAGFAKLLKKSNLTKTEQLEYLDIIEEESIRLSHMATDILYMTKLENQMILTGSTVFNLSEQIRNAILLLEPEWTPKCIDMDVELNEHYIFGNEEMLKHVWVNLIENAIKFSPQNGCIRVLADENEYEVEIRIINFGSTINDDEKEKIFQKFYQVDKSRNTKGNGIGLAVVKRIVDLHDGYVEVKSENDFTEFKVILPRKYSDDSEEG